ncbi:MAG: glycosyltransferase family 4 protein [Hyphomicrobiales bacterium]
MRVLLVASLDVSLPGGLETHVRELARGLAARGHDVALHARPDPFPPFRVVATIEPDRYDVIHHHAGALPPGVAAVTPLVHTLHFCVAGKMAAYVRLGRLRTLVNPANWRARAAERRAARHPGPAIAVSRRVLEEFVRHHALDRSRATVIPNGVSFEAPPEGRAAWRARHGIPETTPLLLTIGRDDFVKGTDLLARAWRRVRETLPDALWVTAGGAAPRREPGRLTTGPIPHGDVLSWIAAADRGALPSYYEGCSVALLEMLAGGLPCLAHDVGNAAEVLPPGSPAGAILPRHAAEWIDALIAALGARAAPAAPPSPATPATPPAASPPLLGPEFAWDAVAGRVEEVYRWAVGAGPAAVPSC